MYGSSRQVPLVDIVPPPKTRLKYVGNVMSVTLNTDMPVIVIAKSAKSAKSEGDEKMMSLPGTRPLSSCATRF